MSASAPGTFVPSIFQFDSQAVRIFVDDQGEPWFCATDVCAVLGYRNTPDAVTKHCRQKGIAKRDTLTKKGQQSLTFINEGNLYRLILKSHLPAAERFEAWVCDEVLPAIRKTGKYEDEAPSQASDIHFDYSTARLDIELNAHRTFTVRMTAIDEQNVADILKATARALYELIDQKLPHSIAFQSWRAAA